ncbi:protein yellow-like isoform X1 [Myzus persicae]|uniref:protein yellow-like isoform X1 n=1 Tax=Myzus persicae TaxID=13164 RepID=UPI000B93109F|nr:protein yellow-like isoform X1 [Myzus persicae]
MRRLILILFAIYLSSAWSSRIKEVFSLKQIYFSHINETTLKNETKREPANVMPQALERWQNKLFLVTPRFKLDVPVTISYINITNMESYKNNTPILIPYPDWKMNEISEHNFKSVVKVRADVCDRLWILDNGKINNKQESIPVIHVYDLKNDMHLRTFDLGSLSTINSDITNMEVDVTSSTCEDAYAYIPDSETYRLLVYSWRTNESNSISHNYFHFDPLCGDIDLGEVHFQSQKGLYGIALSPTARDGFRTIYFHSVASTMGFEVSSRIIHSGNYDKNLNVYDFKVMGNRGTNKQATSSSFDMETGVLFYGLLLKNVLGCWNSYSGEEYNELTQGVISLDNSIDMYPADVRVDRTGNLWVLSNSFQIYNKKNYDQNLINVKIYMTPVRQVIKGSICDEM